MRRDWQVGVDVGGTFTDGVLVRPGAEPLAAKSLADSADPLAGLRSCLDRLATAAGVDRGGLLRRTSKLAYGTTLAANALVEGKVARTGFITTRGFRDTLLIAGIGRERIGHDLTASRPPSLVPRRLILEVRERIDALGRVVAPLRHDDVRAAMAVLQDEGVEAVGVCLLWSFLNRAHELELAEALRSHDGWYICLSSEVAPLLGEYERSATTALNAMLGPRVRSHLDRLEVELQRDGLAAPLLIMQSSGGLSTSREASCLPVSLLASGPAGGVLACRLLAQAMQLPNVICADMGGTTFEVSLINEGEPARRERARYAGQEVLAPGLEVESIGAGGGSLGWIDHGVLLKVGPQSAGACPGPACYGAGGTGATVTDADLLLGRLNPEGLVGGSLALDRSAAEQALAALGRPLRLSAVETAEGMLEVVDAAMADEIRAQTVRRGLDPVGYVLFAYGGAAPLHAAAIAGELGIRTVVVPALAPVFSAFGAVASDILHVLTASVVCPVEEAERIAEAYWRLEAEAARRLAADGVPSRRRLLARSAQARFRGQLHAVQVAVAPGTFDSESAARLRGGFIAEYERLFGPGTASPEAGVEVTSVRVDAVGRVRRPALELKRTEPARQAVRPPRWQEVQLGGEAVRAGRYQGPLPAGSELEGPALVDFAGHTVLVPEAAGCRCDRFGSLILELAR